MTAEQFTELLAYSRVEPFGYQVDNFRSGIIASTVAAAHGKNLPPDKFFPAIGEPVDVDSQSQAEQMQILMMAGNANSKPN